VSGARRTPRTSPFAREALRKELVTLTAAALKGFGENHVHDNAAIGAFTRARKAQQLIGDHIGSLE